MKPDTVNLDYLKEMSGEDRDLMLEMIGIFIDEVPDYMMLMRKFLKNGDWDALGKIAHKAKASASIMGIQKLADDLMELETAAREGENFHMYPTYVERIEQQFTDAAEELKIISRTL